MIGASEIRTIRDLIARMAHSQGNSAFLISPETGQMLTFKDLHERSQTLFHWFLQLGLEQGDKIGLLMDNGLLTAQLFLGAMYGGFVAVPLNVRGGRSQLTFMLDHCDAKVVFVSSDYLDLFNEAIAGVTRQIKCISVDLESWPQVLGMAIPLDTLPPVKPEDAAMLMYSSGTTGQPNAAVHTHRSLLAHGRNTVCSHQLTASDRSLLVLPFYHINAECVTLLPVLSSGGSVVVPTRFDVSEFWNWLDDFDCTWSALVPTIISQLLDWPDPKVEERAAAFRLIRFLRTSSAPLSPSLHREFIERFKLPLIQAMGSSEAGNVFSNPVPPGINKIGSPGLPWGFDAKIVNREGTEVCGGEPGEVLLRGDGMMQGYYKDPVGTAIALDEGNWLHTGDLAYRDDDGYFFVVGRSKELVIKGGVNIAPKQIDEVLESHPAVFEAAAVGVPDRYVGEDLIAFAVLRDGMTCNEGELLSFCEGLLGHFKTPTRICFVNDLPKGPSGKVQRLRLLEDQYTRVSAILQSDGSETRSPAAGPSPHNHIPLKDLPLEKLIGALWSELLEQPLIDPNSNFFALGGQSLLAIQYLSRLRKTFPLVLSLRTFFENPTIAQQVALVRDGLVNSPKITKSTSHPVDVQSIPLRDKTMPCPLSPAQERLWFMEQFISGEPAYNEAEAVRLRGQLDLGALEKALNIVIERHEILRSTINVKDGKGFADIHTSWPVRIKLIDLSALSHHRRELELEQLLIHEPRRPYRLDAEPGIRATIIRLATDEHAFILMMHHNVCDSSSLGILWRELGVSYEASMAGQSSELAPLPIQYGDYAAWQLQPIQQASFSKDLSFWRDYLRGAPHLIDLPTDRPRPSIVSYRGNKLQFCFETSVAESLRQFCRLEKSSLFVLFATAVSVLLYRYTGQEDILLGVPIADRDRPEIQPLIGFLIDTQVLRTDLSGNPSFREVMAQVQKNVASVYSHRAAPFDQVVAAVQPERNLSYSPLFQVMLNWRDPDDQPQFIGMPRLVTEPLLAHAGISKFDLTLVLTDTGDSIPLEIEYSTDLFDKARIERMVGHLRSLLEGAAGDPEQRIAALPLLTSSERQQLLEEWNAASTGFELASPALD